MSERRRKHVTRMIDVGEKPATRRRAVAEGFLVIGRGLAARLAAHRRARGARRRPADPIEQARLAGIMAAKRTWDLLPLCHPLPLDHVSVEFERGGDRIRILATASARAPTGVEMEALAAVTFSGLALAGFLRTPAKTPALEGVRLLAKTGGRSGDYSSGARRPGKRLPGAGSAL